MHIVEERQSGQVSPTNLGLDTSVLVTILSLLLSLQLHNPDPKLGCRCTRNVGRWRLSQMKRMIVNLAINAQVRHCHLGRLRLRPDPENEPITESRPIPCQTQTFLTGVLGASDVKQRYTYLPYQFVAAIE